MICDNIAKLPIESGKIKLKEKPLDDENFYSFESKFMYYDFVDCAVFYFEKYNLQQ